MGLINIYRAHHYMCLIIIKPLSSLILDRYSIEYDLIVSPGRACKQTCRVVLRVTIRIWTPILEILGESSGTTLA
uniref:Uncharacterized protein n=1 Tax=Salix viminalis TaxID=40686 RepID=A0A6N2JXS3_SALVM